MRTCMRRGSGSSCTSGCPAFTSCPSATNTRSIGPSTRRRMATLATGSTLPTARTGDGHRPLLDSRSDHWHRSARVARAARRAAGQHPCDERNATERGHQRRATSRRIVTKHVLFRDRDAKVATDCANRPVRVVFLKKYLTSSRSTDGSAAALQAAHEVEAVHTISIDTLFRSAACVSARPALRTGSDWALTRAGVLRRSARASGARAPARAPPAAAAPAPPAREHAGVRLPDSGQSADQRLADRYECYLWSVKQSGFDPSQPRSRPISASRSCRCRPQGTDTVAGAATGAILGAVIANPHNAAAGAVGGAIVGGAAGRGSDAAARSAGQAGSGPLRPAEQRAVRADRGAGQQLPPGSDCLS